MQYGYIPDTNDWVYNTIAFTAYPGNEDYIYEDGEFLIFNETTVNIGGHYDTKTGYFTVPVDGIYFFSLVLDRL